MSVAFKKQSLFLILLFLPLMVSGKDYCIECHRDSSRGLNTAHHKAGLACVSCHMGQQSEHEEQKAHEGLIASPGELANASFTCGACHAKHVEGVLLSRMHTGSGIVKKTRNQLEPEVVHSGDHTFQELKNGLADSLLRKLCVSCHLGQTGNRNNNDPVKARGGGCLACHLSQQDQPGHPGVSVKVDDSRCFGCHSRSGRISLNYAGLAEAGLSDLKYSREELSRLSDGRIVHQETADIHHKAGMACIDCHTGTGLMSLKDGGKVGGKAGGQESSVDISCNDCHANRRDRITPETWPTGFRSMLERIPFKYANDQSFLQTASGTPLWHIKLEDKQLKLHPKLGGKPLGIPQIDAQHLPLPEVHSKLGCDTCHAGWVPQCLGCHVKYDDNQKQWDHLSQEVTSGRWLEKRWDIGAGRPVLGWRDENTIDVFIPGMVMSLQHPEFPETRYFRKFARVSPHTTGKARDCKSCHESALMLGLGKGKLKTGEHLEFVPARKAMPDGLAADAWTSLGVETVQAVKEFPRPLSKDEIQRIYRASTDFKQE